MSFIVLDKTYVAPLKEWMNAVGKPSNANALNRCIKDLIDAGIWNELDLFHLIGGLDSDDQRLRPLITTSTTKTFTAVASPTLNYNGVTGDGSSSYLNLKFIYGSHAVKSTQDSTSFGFYSRTNSDAPGVYDMGTQQGAPDATIRAMMFAQGSNTMNGTVNTNTLVGKTNTSGFGLFSIARTTATNINFIRNGGIIGTDNTASIGVVSGGSREVFLCTRNANGSPLSFSTKNFSMCFIGSSNFDQQKFYTIIQQYMTEVGLAV